ncbi:MAG TPA: hypothetical protein DDW76_15530 [Cyanobacteria bacterium UBA11369]|nr:hypothetical protein [Cyanobacteria bacterium UBA11371]HBE33628.1 hypothetical protein [Cyanobacteria bacterium UBA11368]HBE50162.1 hypothetical protein [Cyanobacteria bacterium UBA11369]
MLKVFVYGTLKPGEINYQRFCAGKVAEEKRAIAQGHLFALPFGYPAMTPGDRRVQGYLLTFADPEVLRALDRLEGYDPERLPEHNEYNRQLIETFNLAGEPLQIAWAYLMNPHKVRSFGGIFLSSGCWSNCGDSP